MNVYIVCSSEVPFVAVYDNILSAQMRAAAEVCQDLYIEDEAVKQVILQDIMSEPAGIHFHNYWVEPAFVQSHYQGENL